MKKKLLMILVVMVMFLKGMVQAQEIVVNKEVAKDQLVKVEQTVDYYLSYPGILPDHPFYWLKMVRDRIQLWLTTGSLVRAEKLLLYADKRLGAGWALVEGNKKELGVTTLTKAEKYLEQAVNVSLDLSEGEKETAFKVRLSKAIRKHNQVLDLLQEKLGVDLKLVEEAAGGEEASQLLEEVEISIDFGNGEEAIELVQAGTVFEALQIAVLNRGWEILVKEYDFGNLVESINGFTGTSEKAWIYFINGQSGTAAADKQELKSGDLVEWKFIKPEF